GQTRVLANPVDEAAGVRVQPARVEGKNLNVRLDPHRHIDQGHVFGAAEGNGDLIEVGEGIAENLLGGFRLQLAVDVHRGDGLKGHEVLPMKGMNVGPPPAEARGANGCGEYQSVE